MALELVNKLPYDHPYRWDGTAVGGVKLWRPSELGASLALWLDAEDTDSITLNGGNVSQWGDKSGNNNHASQATAAEQPTYSETDFNGKPAIVWPNSGNSIRLTTPSFSAQTFFFVTRYSTGTQNTWHASLQGLFGEATTPAGVIGLIGTAAGTDTWYNANQFSDLRFDGGAETNTNIGGLVALPLPNTVLAASAGSPKAVGDGWVLGCDRLLNGRGWSGPISEIIATPTILSTENRQKLEGYLAWKWGLTANLPADHPYKTTPPVVTQAPVYDADAQTYITAVETADGQTLESAVKTAINDFVVGCKADGIWTAIKTSVILAGARTLTGALTPLVGAAPTNFNFVGADYNRKTGLVGDGSTKYLDTNRNNNADPQDDNHNAFWLNTDPTATTRIMSAGGTQTGVNSLLWFSDQFGVRNRNSNPVYFTAGVSGIGLFGVSRNNSENVQLRVGGTTNTYSTVSQTPHNANINLFQGDNAFYFDGRIAFYSIGEALDLAALDTRASALMTAIDGAIA